jgi:hypothetical protein
MRVDVGGLTPERLKQWVSYDPDSGLFHWLKSPRFNVSAGSEAGHRITSGHPSLVIGIGGRYYRAHRLAWLYVTGAWPQGEIDHINGCPWDNRFSNLRDVTKTVNCQNRRSPSKSSSTGYLGVTATGSKSKPFRAQLTVAGRNVYVGVFDTPEAAHAAYVERKRQVHEGCTL